MSIAYKKIEIDGVSVHLTEVARRRGRAGGAGGGGCGGGPAQSINNTMINGWSCDLSLNIYGFCKVKLGTQGDLGPEPDTTSPAFVETIFIPSSATSTPSGGKCQVESFVSSQPIGTNIDASNNALNLGVSLICGTQSVDYFPISRHISCTVHGSSTIVGHLSLY